MMKTFYELPWKLNDPSMDIVVDKLVELSSTTNTRTVGVLLTIDAPIVFFLPAILIYLKC